MPRVSTLLAFLSLSAGVAWAQVPTDGGAPPVAASTPKPAEVPDGGAKGKLSPPPPTQVVSSPTGSPADRQKWLKDQIDSALGDPELAKAKVGIDVVDVDSGKTLYARNDAGLFNPASNVKLFTTAAALAMLGPEYRWKTVVYADAPISGGELKGRLYVKGHGDPSLVVEDLWRVVSRSLRRRPAQGLGRSRRRRHLLRRRPRRPRLRAEAGGSRRSAPPTARSRSTTTPSACTSCPAPTTPRAARVVIDPATPYFTVVNDARTVASGRTVITVEARETADHTELRVAGRIRLGAPEQILHAPRRPSRPVHGQRLQGAARAPRHQAHRQRRPRRHADDGARALGALLAAARRRRARRQQALATTSWPSRS